MTARKTIDLDTEERLLLSEQIVEQMSYFLSQHPSLWATSSVTATRDELYCRLAVPHSLFGTATAVFEPGLLPASFSTAMLNLLVNFGKEENLKDDGTFEVWRDTVLQIVQYGLEHPLSTMAQVIRDGLMDENASSQRQPPSMMVRSSSNESTEGSPGVWALVWDCAIDVCKKSGMFWENAVVLSEAVPSGLKWADTGARWGVLIKKTFELASAAQVSSSLVVSRLVPHISAAQFGFVNYRHFLQFSSY